MNKSYYSIELARSFVGHINVYRGSHKIAFLQGGNHVGSCLKHFITYDSHIILSRRILEYLPHHELQTGISIDSREPLLITEEIILYSPCMAIGSTKYRYDIEANSKNPDEELLRVYSDTLNTKVY